MGYDVSITRILFYFFYPCGHSSLMMLRVNLALVDSFRNLSYRLSNLGNSLECIMSIGAFYRSDLRAPDDIFVNGFQKRNTSYASAHVRYLGGPDMAPDITPQSAVCFSRHFEAAALFPVSNLTSDSHIYAFAIDVMTVFNTQSTQWNHAVSRNFSEPSANLWPMFGQERAANSIPADKIIGAVHIKRIPNGTKWIHGMNFIPYKVSMNSRFKGSLDFVNNFIELTGEILNTTIRCPTMSDGYVKSE